MRVLLVISTLLLSCTYTPTKQRRDIAVQGALRQTGCRPERLKITNAVLTSPNPDCNGCNGCNCGHHSNDEIKFVAVCGDRTWTCVQTGMTECVETVAKPRAAEQLP